MKAFKEHFPDSDERLLYGTDWSMIAQEERFPKLFSSRPFPDVMVFFLRAVGYSDAQIEGIMFRNAVRFLGLGKAERDRFGEKSTRARLEKFYAAHKLSSDWMEFSTNFSSLAGARGRSRLARAAQFCGSSVGAAAARLPIRRRPGDDFLGFRIEGLDRMSRRTQRLVHHARAQ